MTTFGPHPGVRGEGALSWESWDDFHVAEGGLNSPASPPSPLLPPFPLCHQLPSVFLITGVLCCGTRPWGDVGPAQVLASEQELLQECSCRTPMHGTHN